MVVDNNWDEFFAFDSKSPELPAPKVTPKKTTPIAATRKPTPISPLHRRRSNLRDYMVNHVTPPTTDDDDWDKDFEGGLTLRSPQVASPPIPPLPPLSPKKTPSSPRKLSPPKMSTGNISDDNSKTIRPATVSRSSQSRQVSMESTASSSSNTVRGVSVSPLPMANRPKPPPRASTALKKRSKGRKITSHEDLSDDGYDDLIKGDESKFNMKVNSLKVHSVPTWLISSGIYLPRQDYFILLI